MSRLNFAERAALCDNALAKSFFELMHLKKSNLCLSVDVYQSDALLALADSCGPEICLLKTHIDTLSDFTPDVITKLNTLAKKHNFMIFEDRKFADIGNTVKAQYSGGIYKIADWAQITNAHLVPGPGIIEGLRSVGLSKGRGLLLLAEMSASGNLATDAYTATGVAWAKEYSDFVIGFIAQQRLTDDPRFIHMAPGVSLVATSDGLRQSYMTPADAMALGNDVIIVGRGICQSAEPAKIAAEYRAVTWACLS